MKILQLVPALVMDINALVEELIQKHGVNLKNIRLTKEIIKRKGLSCLLSD